MKLKIVTKLSLLLLVTIAHATNPVKNVLQDLRNYAKKLKDKIKAKLRNKPSLAQVSKQYDVFVVKLDSELDRTFKIESEKYNVLMAKINKDLEALEQQDWRNGDIKISESTKQTNLKVFKNQIENKLFPIRTAENLTLTEMLNAQREMAEANYFIPEMKKLVVKDIKVAQELREALEYVPEEKAQQAKKNYEAQLQKRNANLAQLKKVAEEVAAYKQQMLNKMR